MNEIVDSAILSRPRYGRLQPVDAPYHVFIADDDGGDIVASMATKTPEGFFSKAEIIYINSRGQENNATLGKLNALQCPRLYTGVSINSAIPRMSASLQRIKMGTQLYLCGSESLLGVATMIAMQAGLDHQGLQTQHCGSLARRVQCVHCKGITENITTQPANCEHCALLLLVRDHYSRRVAAFQGVNINAEDPTEMPVKEEIFL